MTLEEALSLLRQYSCIEPKIPESAAAKTELRQAILLVTGLSEAENLGICADNVEQGLTSLTQYGQALGYKVELKENTDFEGNQVVYIKYSSQKQTYFVDSYSGEYRGVLISCQSENETIVGTYGHFPLDLFAEGN